MPQYEYSMGFTSMTLKPGIGDATGDEISEGLTANSMQIVKAMSHVADTMEGGGWQIISHGLTRLDRHLIASFLLRRPKPNK